MQAKSYVAAEIASQPDCWRDAGKLAREVAHRLPRSGERIAVVGCGTSLFMAMAYSSLRESRGFGVTDAFPASEMPASRLYDRVLAITRSGTTTEILEVLDRKRSVVPTLVITGDSASPVVNCADDSIGLDFADERSVVQTRFATTTLALLRSSLGEDVEPLAVDAGHALERPIESFLLEADELTFLGRAWTTGLAHEAALKLRESSGSWTESYPAMEYRHGPISIAQQGRVTWMFGAPPDGLTEQVKATGAYFVADPELDPMADLVRVQRLAVARAAARNMDPDRPRNLSRSVVLEPS